MQNGGWSKTKDIPFSTVFKIFLFKNQVTQDNNKCNKCKFWESVNLVWHRVILWLIF